MIRKIPDMPNIESVLMFARKAKDVNVLMSMMHSLSVGCYGLSCYDSEHRQILSVDNLADLVIAGHRAEVGEYPSVELEIEYEST